MNVWLAYEPISTFELRPSNTTKTGGKTLLCPTPYAIRMALLDRLIRLNGIDAGFDLFPIVRDMGIALKPPMSVAINRTFQKILRPPFKDGEWKSTIAMREFCVHAGWMEMVLGLPDEAVEEIITAAVAVNYFGQRGSFFQVVDWAELDDVPSDFVDITRPTEGLQMGYLQRMDDMLPDATFGEINTLQPDGKRNRIGARHSYNVVFPYELAHHAANHTVWQRMEPEP